MESHLSERMKPMNPSAIREIFKFAGLPGMISFAGGNPSERTFPAQELAEVSAKLFAEKPTEILQYGISEGYAPQDGDRRHRDYRRGNDSAQRFADSSLYY